MSPSGTEGAWRQLADHELAERLASGETEALSAIAERYQQTVLRVTRRILRDDAEASDAAQDVFLEILCDISKFDSRKGEFAAWVKKLAQRRSLDQRRYLARRGFYSAPSGAGDVSEQSSTLLPLERSRWTEELLSALEPEERRCFTLKYLEGHTAREVAEMTGESISKVHHTLFEARRKLQALLNGR
jgi:RNA polymerase sigma-70 factor (ECF subfamily)